MQKMKTPLRFTVAILLASGLMTAKERNWQTGKVLDSAPYAPTQIQQGHATVKENHVVIEGVDYTYTINDETVRQPGTISFDHAHGCRYIVGEEIQYATEKRLMYVRDVDCKECKVEILRQEKLPAPAPHAKP
jgi:hypothetical protein